MTVKKKKPKNLLVLNIKAEELFSIGSEFETHPTWCLIMVYGSKSKGPIFTSHTRYHTVMFYIDIYVGSTPTYANNKRNTEF